MDTIDVDVQESKERLDLLHLFAEDISEEDSVHAWEAFAYPKMIYHTVKDAQSQLVVNTKHFMDELGRQVKGFVADLARYDEEVERLKVYDTVENSHEYAHDVAELTKRFEE
eukprot:9318013-Pyramimonas_sp.AAC.1